MLALAFVSAALTPVALAETTPPLPVQEGPPTLALSLQEAIELALQGNRTLYRARIDRELQRFDLRMAEDEFLPDLDIGASYDHDQATAGDPVRYGSLTPRVRLRIPTGGEFSIDLPTSVTVDDDAYASSATVRFSQPLLRGGGIRTATLNLRSARRGEEMNVLGFASTVMSIVDSTISAYRGLILAGRRLEISATSLQRAEEQLAINRVLIETGRMAEQEAVQAESAIADRELSLSETQNSLDDARLRLIDVLDVSSLTQINPTDTFEIRPFSGDVDESLETAFANRPDYLSTLLQFEGVEDRLAWARNNRLWDLSLSAVARGSGDGTSLGDSFDGGIETLADLGDYGIGLSLRVPIYGDLSRKRSMLSATAALRKAEVALVELRQDIDIEVRRAVRDVGVRLRQVGLAERGLQLTEQQLVVERERLRRGLTSNFRLAAYEDDLVAAEDRHVNTVVSYLDALTQLDRTLGTTLNTWGIAIEAVETPPQLSQGDSQ